MEETLFRVRATQLELHESGVEATVDTTPEVDAAPPAQAPSAVWVEP